LLPIGGSLEHSWFAGSIFVFAVIIFVFVSVVSLAFTFATAVLTSFATFTIFITIRAGFLETLATQSPQDKV